MNNQKTSVLPSERIADFQPYFFARLNKTIEKLKEANIDVIRMDMGSPDMPPAKFIIDKMIEQVQEPHTHGYSPHGGTKAFREAACHYYRQRFNVILDPQSEVFGLIGSKEGLFHFCQVLTNPGDINLVPDPGYPVYSASTKIAGGTVYGLPIKEENDYLPDFSQIPTEVLSKAKILWLNYPNNPTGAVATLDFLQQAVNFARQHNLIIGYDNPYADICFADYQAPSILQIDGAKDVGVEFLSFSKTYNMAGWRLGIAAGNSQILQLLLTYKSQVDSSHFAPILAAGTAALTGDQSWLQQRNQTYFERQNIVVSSLQQCGFHCPSPKATIYVWAKLPENFQDDVSMAAKLLEDTGVSVTPGSIYGECGKGYIRISLCTDSIRTQEAMTRLKGWFHNTFKEIDI